MRKFFYPESVVVVGVTPVPQNLGRNMVENLLSHGYKGKIFAVGLDGGHFRDIDIHVSVSRLPEPVDLAAILTPAKAVPGVIRECGEKGIRRAAILSAGFGELSTERLALQQELVDTAKHYGLRFVGPNCMGIVCPESGLALPFTYMRPGAIKHGPLTVLSQSGSVSMLSSWYATDAGLGIAKFVSMGNKLNMDESDLLPYFLEEDDQTKVVGIYLEGLAGGRRFFDLARKSKKPVVVLKANISKETEHAARSHTASLASDDRVVDGAFRQAGIVRITELNELSVATKAVMLPRLGGDNIGAVVSTGGVSVLTTDFCFRHGFRLPDLPATVLGTLHKNSRAKVINYGNPIDLGDGLDNDTILSAAEQVLALPEIDGVVFSPFHTHSVARRPGPDSLEIVERVAALMRQYQKPVLLSFLSEPTLLRELIEKSPFPIFSNFEESLHALDMLRDYSRFRSRPASNRTPLPVDAEGAERIVTAARRDGRLDIGPAAMNLLASYGLPAASLHFASREEDAMALAEELGFPVVLKAVAAELSHKSDVGGVIVNLADKDAVREGFRRIQRNLAVALPNTALAGVVVQRMVDGGQEVILGAKRDEHFGPVVMVGLGGIFTELMADVSFRLAPLADYEAEEMIWELKGARLLTGLRGQPPADVPALVDALCRLGQLIADRPEIQEIDVNPIKVFTQGNGAIAVDARVVVAR